jgi:hypothetical protein
MVINQRISEVLKKSIAEYDRYISIDNRKKAICKIFNLPEKVKYC